MKASLQWINSSVPEKINLYRSGFCLSWFYFWLHLNVIILCLLHIPSHPSLGGEQKVRMSQLIVSNLCVCRKKKYILKYCISISKAKGFKWLHNWVASWWTYGVFLYDWLIIFSEYSYSRDSRACHIGPAVNFIHHTSALISNKKIKLCLTCIIIHCTNWYLMISFHTCMGRK